jgi:hypothetical protein
MMRLLYTPDGNLLSLRDARFSGSIRRTSYGKLAAALLASPSQDFPAVAVGHSLPETVRSLSFPV